MGRRPAMAMVLATIDVAMVLRREEEEEEEEVEEE